MLKHVLVYVNLLEENETTASIVKICDEKQRNSTYVNAGACLDSKLLSTHERFLEPNEVDTGAILSRIFINPKNDFSISVKRSPRLLREHDT
jgi:hypothetical protein